MGSDVDVPVSFHPAATWSLRDLTTMEDEFTALVGRPVDLVEKEGRRNPSRRHDMVLGDDHRLIGDYTLFRNEVEIRLRADARDPRAQSAK